jgi:hypothetical protein
MATRKRAQRVEEKLSGEFYRQCQIPICGSGVIEVPKGPRQPHKDHYIAIDLLRNIDRSSLRTKVNGVTVVYGVRRMGS